MICFGESRKYLQALGIAGEIIPTRSHSTDSLSVVLDNGDCIVGDLQPGEFADGYPHPEALEADWQRIMGFCPKRILFAHMPEVITSSGSLC